MSAANHETPTRAPLRVGLIADPADALRLADTLRHGPLRVVAQAGMRQTERLPDAEWFDDTRAMIAQAGIEAVLLCGSVRSGVQLGKTALERGVHVWRPPPLGRNFAEATEVLRAARAHRTVYRVASWWDHVVADVRALLAQREGFKPRFSDLRVRTAGPAAQSWRASAAEAGAGVLAGDAYNMLEALIALRHLPQSVSAVVGNYRRKTGEAPRETEDVAAAILRYEGDGAAALQATWDIPPFQCVSSHHDSEATLVLDDSRAAITSADGRLLHERRLSSEVRAAEIERFGAALRAGKRPSEPDAALERHLAVSALLETIFLSARTAQPETPARLFEVQGWRAPRL